MLTALQLCDLIKAELALPVDAIKQTLDLVSKGGTIPFIARYRKEQTGGLDEMHIAAIVASSQKYKTLEARKETILAALQDAGVLTKDLENAIRGTWNGTDLEDIYLPFRKKRKTRADLAREQGLEPLAQIILAHKSGDLEQASLPFIHAHIPDVRAALNGARDIIAEWFSEHTDTRSVLRQIILNHGILTGKATSKDEPEKEKFRDYFNFSERLSKIPSHRFLALQRGEQLGILKVKLSLPDKENVLSHLQKRFIKYRGACANQIIQATSDGFERLLYPSLENECRQITFEKMEAEAIRVFAINLKQLLLAAPLGETPVIAIDPGFRSGCKIVCLDAQGNVQEYKTIFPHAPMNKTAEAANTMIFLASKYGATALAIGDGTAGKETLEWARTISFDVPIEIYLVSEKGASIYSASGIAREEFPDLDVTIRGSISIGRRLMDPMAELVKIDPKSIGVGQYQHAVNQSKLKQALEDTTLFAVNQVGVQVNTASAYLLTYVSGIGPGMARSIVDWRKKYGPFKNRFELRKIPRLGDKSFEQCAGFLRIRESSAALDNTGIHPERYTLVEQIAADQNTTVADLIGNAALLQQVNWPQYLDKEVGWPTLNDIRQELTKPGMDIRGKAQAFQFNQSIRGIEDITEGMMLTGIISNLTNFGAFVNLGIKEDGLIHISNIAHKFISHPAEILQLQQEVSVQVLSIDRERKRINLSYKEGKHDC